MSVLPDQASDFGARVRRRLESEAVIWLVTVNAAGVPQPNPVWFLFDPAAESLLVCNDHNAQRLAGIDAHPQVAAHLDGDARGADVIVLTGTLERGADLPAANRNDAYLAKYAADIQRIGMDPDSFADRYSVPLVLRIAKIRGH